MKVTELISFGESGLKETSDTPRLDAKVLISSAINFSDTELITRDKEEVEEVLLERARTFLGRRKSGEPVAYILGEKEFWGLSFKVTPAVLIPRPETEQLVELALEWIGDRDVRVLDLGAGSGCIGVSIAKNAPGKVLVTAVERSKDALLVLEENIKRHSVDAKVTTLQSHWFEGLGVERFDCIISNPPYVEIGGGIGVDHEPDEALFAGEDGLDDYREILPQIEEHLNPRGIFYGEFGSTQLSRLALFAEGALGLDCEVSFHRDLAGLDRVIEIRKESRE